MSDDGRRVDRTGRIGDTGPAAAASGTRDASLAGSMTTLLGDGATPEAVASFFAAAAALWRATPWRLAPDGVARLAISSEDLMLEDVPTVSALEGEERTLRLFAELGDSEEFERLVATTPEQAITSLTSHIAIAFVTADALSAPLREEIERHGWEIAADDAWPLIWCATAEEGIEAPLAIERESAEGAMLTLTAALAEPEPLRTALSGEDAAPFSREFEIFRGGDSAAVTIIAPAPAPPERSLSTAELVARLPGPSAENLDPDEPDELETWRLESELLRRFALDADPSLPHEMLSRCHYVIEMALARFDRDIVGISPDELGRIVLEDVPRELDIDPLAAHRSVEVLRNLFRFLGREAGLARADALATSLDDDIVRRLEEALADPDAHGPAKTARMAVRAAGLEPGSEEADILWARAFERTLVGKGLFDDEGPADFLDPPPPMTRQTPADAKARKKKRKVARKARRKNR